MSAQQELADAVARERYPRGTYLTDGHRLVWVRRVKDRKIIAEEGAVGAPDIVSIPLGEMSGWRIVIPGPLDG